MAQTLLLAVVGLTSIVAFVLALKRWALPPALLGRVARKVVEWVGMTLLFVSANTALTAIGILTIRSVTPWFQSVYLAEDAILIVLSALQGSALQWWRTLAR
jgi:hypothetical protein